MTPGACCRSLLVALSFALFTSGCAQLPSRPDLPAELALPPGGDAPLDRLIAPLEARNPGLSGFRLVDDGAEAFVLRERSAVLAQRSLDVQTYIWHADTTGLFLAHRILEAADRGVKVRLLLDDMDARARNAGIAALAAHPKIEVRVFNPFVTRRGVLSLAAEGLLSFERINHRMHNKNWIADNRIALAGGRNLGDEYFDASDEINFVDLDYVMVGPVVREVSQTFDRYWNSPAAFPMEVLDAAGVTADRLAKLREELARAAQEGSTGRYAAALATDDAVLRLIKGDLQVEWSDRYSFAADDPLKAMKDDNDPDRSRVLQALLPVLSGARSELMIVSPYFVPGDAGTAAFVEGAQKGVAIGIITNSLAATDVAAVHGGYARHRKALLQGGVKLWELKPMPGQGAGSGLFGSSGASLHTKALVADGRISFVGSYNLDPRSTWLNCEQGVLLDNEVIARQLLRLMQRQTWGKHAWQLGVESGRLQWSDGTEKYSSDPQAKASKRFVAWLTGALRLDAQL